LIFSVLIVAEHRWRSVAEINENALDEAAEARTAQNSSASRSRMQLWYFNTAQEWYNPGKPVLTKEIPD
jgi:hypothetical protein